MKTAVLQIAFYGGDSLSISQQANLPLLKLNSILMQAVFPLRKFYTEQMFVLLRTKHMQLRNHADTQPMNRSQR